MTKKRIGAVVMYIAAVIGPLWALIARFGLDTHLDMSGSAESVEQILGLGAAIICGFVLSVVASRWVGSESESLTAFALRVLRDARNS